MVGRIAGTTDEQMVAWPKTLIAAALHAIADRYAIGPTHEEDELNDRYLDAICRSGDPVPSGG